MICHFTLNVFVVPYACWTLVNTLEMLLVLAMGYVIFYWLTTR
jgi:hypothetical protein